MNIQNSKLFKKLSVLLAFTLLLAMPTAAFAAWDTYGGNNEHNAVISNGPKAGATGLTTPLQLTHNGSGWDGVDNVPVMRTVGDTTYAYVLYDGYRVQGNNGGARLAKVNCNTKQEVWNIQVEPEAGFQLSTPLLVRGATEAEDVLYVATSNAGQVLPAFNTQNWNITGAIIQGNQVVIPSGTTANLRAEGFGLQLETPKRVALGIYLGNSPNIAASATVSWNINGANGSKTFTSSDILEEGNSGRYYFYLNENIGEVPTEGNNIINYSVTVNGVNGEIVYASLYEQGGAVSKVSHLDATGGADLPNWRNILGFTAPGQINTPITTDGEYLYCGIWQGGSNRGAYLQIDPERELTYVFVPESHGFYWAGAVAGFDGMFLYFGGDDGKVYTQERDNIDSSYGGVLDLKTAPNGAADAGNVRSTIMMDEEGKMYFTSQGGYLWCCVPDNENLQILWKVKIADNVKSTSTPTKVGNRIYVGYYQNFSSGGVVCVRDDGNHEKTTVVSGTGFPVQSSILVDGDGTGTDYLYFNTNYSTGAGYCYSFNGSGAGNLVWNTTPDNYALGGMACDNGYIVFGNDRDRLYIVH